MAVIYKITNKINGKVYVGQTISKSIKNNWKCYGYIFKFGDKE